MLSSYNAKKYARTVRVLKCKAFLLALPLIIFLCLFFIVPISFMLIKGVYSPKVTQLAPSVTESITNQWHDIDTLPDSQLFKTLAFALQKMAVDQTSGQFAEEVNRRASGTGSVIKKTARKLRREDLNNINDYPTLLIGIDKRWGELAVWHGILAASTPLSLSYYANALDYRIAPDGSIVAQPEYLRVYLPILWRTFVIALFVTVLTILLGYPLSYYLSFLPNKTANLLLIFVLLPFWTSLLVRTTSWIVLLQTNGVINNTLLTLGIIQSPLDIIYNQFATILAMTHILLPFMVLPLYSVMRSIDLSYVRASQSLGAGPVNSFVHVYFPLSLPGLNAGALLVFIVSVGYYITPALLGGTDGQMISNLIANHMRTTNNWELAAALGGVLLAIIIALYWAYDRVVGIANLKL